MKRQKKKCLKKIKQTTRQQNLNNYDTHENCKTLLILLQSSSLL